MSRYIDADQLPYEKMEISATSNEWCIRLSDIENAPTFDAVEVVRCKDCINYINDEIGWCDLFTRLLPGGEWLAFSEDDFCSYGEREEE